MHLQVRFVAKSSPWDVEKALGRLAERGVNLIGVGGSDVEFGGEVAVVPEEGQEEQALEALRAYHPRVLYADDPDSGLRLCIVDHQSGGLHACLREIAAENLEKGRIIRDILVGVPTREQSEARQVPVQVYSETIRTFQTIDADMEGVGASSYSD